MTQRRFPVEGRGSLLIEVLGARDPGLIASAERLLKGDVISFEDVDAIRMAIGDELMESGIDSDTGSVDQRGVELDALIDWVASLDRSARGEPG